MAIQIGDLSIDSYIGSCEVSGISNISDVLVSATKAYVVSSPSEVVPFSSSDISSGEQYSPVNWSEQDPIIKEIHTGDSISSAYTVFTKNGQDFLFGWSHNKELFYTWKIDSSGNISNRQEFTAPSSCNSYSRAGWNGKDYVHLINNDSSHPAYIFNIDSHDCVTITDDVKSFNIFSSSYTANGLFINGNYIYSGDGCNDNDGLLFCWDITKRKLIKVIHASELTSEVGGSAINSNNGNLTLSPYHKQAYYFAHNKNQILIYKVSGMELKNIKRSIKLGELETDSNSCNFEISNSKHLNLKAGDTLTFCVRAGVKNKDTVLYGEASDTTQVKLYFNNLPSIPPSVTAPTGACKVGTEVTVSWGASSDSDGETVKYYIDFYNGKEWSNIATNHPSTSYVYTIPPMEDTSQAKFRVQSYDGRDLCEEPKESSVFSVYNNSAPSNPSAFLTPTSGHCIKPLQVLSVNWGNAVDSDEGDSLTYTLEFFNGSDWSIIGTRLTETKLNHLIPKMRGIKNAKYRVKAFDGKDYSPYTESNEFEILDVDLERLATPNAISLDGKDDKIPLGENPVLSFTKQFTIGLKKIKLEKLNYEYPIITKMFGESKPSYALHVTPEGHLKLSFGHSSNSNDSLETTEDFTGRWNIIEAFVDTEKGTMGIKVDGKIVASKEIPKGEGIIEAKGASTDIGYNYTTQKYGKFQVSGIALFNKNLSNEESDNFRNNELKGDEDGLVVYYPLNDYEKGAIIFDKTSNSINATLYGGIEWGFQFALMQDVRVPYPNNPQVKENIITLRNLVNEFRQSNGLPVIKWTDSVLKERVTPIKAKHWNELQEAVLDVYSKMGQNFINPSTEEELKDKILPHNNKYEIKNLPSRIVTILNAIQNK